MVNFPVSLDNDATLYVAVNNKRTTLTSAINDVTLTIPVTTTSGFPTSGFITILSDATDVTKAEAIKYSSTTSNSFLATQRGAGLTPALNHNSGDNVDLTVIADHHNELKDAIINLEHFVGTSGAKNFLPMDPITGNVIVVGTLTVSGGSTFAFVTVTGSLVGPTGLFTTSVRSAAVSGTVINANTLNVSGNTVMAGNLTVTGTATLGVLVVTGTTTVTGTSRFVGDMRVDNQVQVGFNPNWVTASGKTVQAGIVLADTVAATDSLTVSGAPVSTGTSYPVESLNALRGFVTVTGIGSAFTNTIGQIITISGQPSTAPDPLNVGTVNASISLTISGVPVATGTSVPDPLNIGTVNAATSLTISGVPVATGTLSVPDPLNIGTVNASTSLTISGVPVATGTKVSSLNALTNDVVVSGAGTVTTNVAGQLIVISGSSATVPDPLTIGTLNVTESLTISGVPVATGTGVVSLNSLQNEVTLAGAGSVTILTAGQTITASGNPASVPDPLNVGTATVADSLTISGVPVATGTNRSVLLGGLSVAHTTNLTTADHVKWNTVIASVGTNISLDTTTTYTSTPSVASLGRFTLQPGPTYEILCDIAASFTGATGDAQLRIQLDSGSQPSGAIVALRLVPTSSTGNLSANCVTTAVVRPTVATRYEIGITANTALSSINTSSYLRILEL